MSGPVVTLVRACLRDGRGGSPTAVLAETDLCDAERRSLPARLGTSHVVFVAPGDGASDVSLRFFTGTGELPACGHGTVAALAHLAERDGRPEYRAALRTPGRSFTGRVTRAGGRLRASFDPGAVRLETPSPGVHEPVLRALGVTSDAVAVASTGRPRLLVRVASRARLAALAPDFGRLRDACDRYGLLGCYVYCVSPADGRVTARMFAPSVGVPEDIANANSTACLAAHLARTGLTDLTVDMGDSLGAPSTIYAGIRPGETGPVLRVGGAAAVTGHVRL